jgi:predicted transcriptional regulator YdeE
MDRYTTETLPIMHIIGIEQKLHLQDQEASKKIGEFWQQFFLEGVAAKIPYKANSAYYSIYTDYTEEGTYKHIIGAAVTSLDKIPMDMVHKIIPAQTYAVFNAHGPFSISISEAWQTIWTTKINRAFTADFEIYDQNSTNDEGSIVRIYVAIK